MVLALYCHCSTKGDELYFLCADKPGLHSIGSTATVACAHLCLCYLQHSSSHTFAPVYDLKPCEVSLSNLGQRARWLGLAIQCRWTSASLLVKGASMKPSVLQQAAIQYVLLHPELSGHLLQSPTLHIEQMASLLTIYRQTAAGSLSQHCDSLWLLHMFSGMKVQMRVVVLKNLRWMSLLSCLPKAFSCLFGHSQVAAQ